MVVNSVVSRSGNAWKPLVRSLWIAAAITDIRTHRHTPPLPEICARRLMETTLLGRFLCHPSLIVAKVGRLASDGVVQKPGEVTGVGGCGSPALRGDFLSWRRSSETGRRLKRRFEADCGGTDMKIGLALMFVRPMAQKPCLLH